MTSLTEWTKSSSSNHSIWVEYSTIRPNKISLRSWSSNSQWIQWIPNYLWQLALRSKIRILFWEILISWLLLSIIISKVWILLIYKIAWLTKITIIFLFFLCFYLFFLSFLCNLFKNFSFVLFGYQYFLKQILWILFCPLINVI